MRRVRRVLPLLLVASSATFGGDEAPLNPSLPNSTPRAEDFLVSGRLAAGQQALEAVLAEDADDDRTRFGLGFVKVVRAAERFGRSLHEYGATPNGTRLPIAENPHPAPITYQRFRRVLDDLRRDLVDAEATLARITDDDVFLEVPIARVRLDLDGDGEPTDEFLDLLRRVMRTRDEFPFLAENPDFRVRFDRGDVAWLRGYCHLVGGVLDTVLAFDTEPEFRRSAERNFANPILPEGEPAHDELQGHCVEPKRLARARRHFVAVCTLNHETWEHVRRETDDEFEWLPNPRQTSVLGLPVTDEMIDTWLAMMEEVRATFEGERTFLRIFFQKDGKGLNLRTLFDDPPATWNVEDFPRNLPDRFFSDERDMNFVVVLQGVRAFRGSAVGYALWFN